MMPWSPKASTRSAGITTSRGVRSVISAMPSMYQVAELVRERIKRLGIAHEASDVAQVVTMSFGVATCYGSGRYTERDLLVLRELRQELVQPVPKLRHRAVRKRVRGIAVGPRAQIRIRAEITFRHHSRRPADVAQEDVVRDLKEVGPDPGLVAERCARAERTDERFLHQVLGQILPAPCPVP